MTDKEIEQREKLLDELLAGMKGIEGQTVIIAMSKKYKRMLIEWCEAQQRKPMRGLRHWAEGGKA